MKSEIGSKKSQIRPVRMLSSALFAGFDNTSEQDLNQSAFRDIPDFSEVVSCFFSRQSLFFGFSFFERPDFHFGVPG
jgi:hypothetical protein